MSGLKHEITETSLNNNNNKGAAVYASSNSNEIISIILMIILSSEWRLISLHLACHSCLRSLIVELSFNLRLPSPNHRHHRTMVPAIIYLSLRFRYTVSWWFRMQFTRSFHLILAIERKNKPIGCDAEKHSNCEEAIRSNFLLAWRCFWINNHCNTLLDSLSRRSWARTEMRMQWITDTRSWAPLHIVCPISIRWSASLPLETPP